MHEKDLTLGSLFDGSGGFPLAGILAGIKPAWSSEIEPFPVLVTHRRLPSVKHYGDVSSLSGSELEPVDIITFGSPCQDLSIAGRRAGIQEGQRSSLFFEAVRIIKEMREATDGKYPRYCVWENVPGAFSSNGGDDFRAVLEAVIGIKEEGVQVPAPEDHRWPKADVYLGDGWSLAYRVFDAQYWGVPQRRARIYLVCDFAGGSAPEILFESDGLSGYSPQGIGTWKGTAAGVEEGTGEAGRGSPFGSGRGGIGRYCLNTQGQSGVAVTREQTNTLVAQDHGNHPAVLQAAGFSTEHSAKARSIGYGEEVSPTLRAAQVPAAMSLQHNPSDSRLKIEKDGKVQTLCSRAGTGGNNVPLVAEPKAYGIAKEAFNSGEQAGFAFAINEETSPTLQARGPGAVAKPELKAFGVCSKSSHAMLSVNPHSGFYEAKTSRTLDQAGGNPTCNQGGICVVAPEKEEAIAFEPGAASRVGGHVYADCKAGTLRARAGDNQQAVVFFTQNQRDEVRDLKDKAAALQAQPGAKQQTYVLQGSMIGRKEKNGPQGDGINEDVSFTLTGVDRHAVAAPADDAHYSTSKSSFFTNALKEQAGTLVASDWKDPPCVNDTPNEEPSYIVRRLTPIECARLQAFPDWWCDGLADPDPSEAELAFWMEVWNEWQRINGKKPKTEKQVRKWLSDPHTDSAEYKLWGNGICLNNAFFVLAGIAWTANKEAAPCA
ncbi:MAG: DNA cytosine methyltransferase [Blautia sp.]|nr:DNA cytosine methyltransferase [Blautia sp.]